MKININPALKHRLLDLLHKGSEGQLAADPELLAVLFTLSAMVLTGAERLTAQELAAWYDCEAQDGCPDPLDTEDFWPEPLKDSLHPNGL